LIAALVIGVPLPVSGAPLAEPPPLPRPRPADAPPRVTPHEAAPAEHAKPEPAIDQACLDRLGAAGIEFESITLPPAPKPGCAIETPVRLRAIRLAPRWRTLIRLPDEPTLSCRFGERFGRWLRDLVAPLIAGELAVGSWVTSAGIKDAASKGAPVEFVFPPKAFAAANTTYILKWAKHPNAAQVLMDFLATREGQTAIAKDNVSPLDSIEGTLGPASTVSSGDVKTQLANAEWGKEYYDRWQDIFGR
jgi:hypothetical protein